MPIHDWTRVDAGLFHDFHQSWAIALRNELNARVLPSEYFALIEQNIRGPIPDVLTLQLSPGPDHGTEGGAGIAVATRVPQTRLMRRAEVASYLRKASLITVRHRHGDGLPEMPLFLRPDSYVPAPLEETYQMAWSTFPAALKGMLESPA